MMLTFQFTPIALFYVAGFVVALLVSYISFRMRPIRGARYFALTSASLACWIGGYILGFFNADLHWKVVSLRLEYIGIVFAPVFLFLFVADYVQIHLSRFWYAVISFPSAVTLIAALTFPWHQLLYVDYGIGVLDSGFVVLTKSYGPLFYFWMTCSYVLLVTGTGMMFWGVSHMPRRYRFQAPALGLTISMVIVSNFLFVTGYNPISPNDPTPLAFLIGSVLILINIRVFRFLNIVPVAHHVVFRQVPTAVIVLNELDQVIDLNRSAEAAFAHLKQPLLGSPIDDLVSVDEQTSRLREISLGDRIYDLEITPLADTGGQYSGKVLLFHDVTERMVMQKRQDDLIAKLQGALSEVHLLEGMLPICAQCKNIRDDEGDWHEIENYIHSRSEATFSHGICPECAKKLYPDQPSIHN